MDNIIVDLDIFIDNLRAFDFTDIQINKVIKAINRAIQRKSNESEEILKDIKTILDKMYISINSKEPNCCKTLTVNEAVEYTGIGRDSLLQQIKKVDTDFPYFKVGSKTLIDKEMLDEWIKKIIKEHRGI